MAARIRVERSLGGGYRANLKKEQLVTDRQLRGRVIWSGRDGMARKVFSKSGMFLTNGKKSVRI